MRCVGKDALYKMFAADGRYEAVSRLLLEHVDSSAISMTPGTCLYRGCVALLARLEPPDHVWVDSLSMRHVQRERFRGALIYARLLEARQTTVVSARTWRPGLGGDGIFDVCSVERRLATLMDPYPALVPLKHLYLQRLHDDPGSARDFTVLKPWAFSIITGLQQRGISLTHATLDDLGTSGWMRALREELMACGMLELRDARAVCAHVTSGHRLPTTRMCLFCQARRRVSRMFEGRPDLRSFETQLHSQIDRGIYPGNMLVEREPMGKALRYVAESTELSHAWVDALSLRPNDRERLRQELIAANLLSKQDRLSAYQKRRLYVSNVSQARCEHGQVPACRRCIAIRRIESALAPYAALQPLRDRLIERVKSRYYPLAIFSGPQKLTWLILHEVGEAGDRVDHAWFAARQTSRVERMVHSEMTACGLLAATRDHPEVMKLQVWFGRFLIEAKGLGDDDRALIEQFCRLWLMRFARRRLNYRTDRAEGVVVNLRARVRHAVELARWVRLKGKTLRTFDTVDVEGHEVHPRHIRQFLKWLRTNDYTTTSWMPARHRESRGYVGLSAFARKEAVSRLLHDQRLALDLRVLGLLSYFGFEFGELATLRASDVLFCGHVVVIGKVYPLHEDVALRMLRLRQQRLDEARDVRPAGWDPWLFTSTKALEPPRMSVLSGRLVKAGFQPRAMRNDGIRLCSSDPTIRFATQRALGRAKDTVTSHLEIFSNHAGSYAAMFADTMLDESQEI